jgi:hypothetical protein
MNYQTAGNRVHLAELIVAQLAQKSMPVVENEVSITYSQQPLLVLILSSEKYSLYLHIFCPYDAFYTNFTSMLDACPLAQFSCLAPGASNHSGRP